MTVELLDPSFRELLRVLGRELESEVLAQRLEERLLGRRLGKRGSRARQRTDKRRNARAHRWRKVEFPDGPTTLTHTWGVDDCDDDGETLRFRLKALRAGLTSTAHKNLFVPGDGLPEGISGARSLRPTAYSSGSSRAGDGPGVGGSKNATLFVPGDGLRASPAHDLSVDCVLIWLFPGGRRARCR